MDLQDDIFQAHCQITYLQDEIENGARIESVDGDTVTLVLDDGSEMDIYLGPVQTLLDGLRRMK